MTKRIVKTLSLLLSVVLIFFTLSSFSTNAAVKSADCVSIINKGSHYEIILNFQKGKNHRQVGQEYGQKLHKILPNYEALMDSYINSLFSNPFQYDECISRINDIKPQIDKDYRDEIEGFASACSGGKDDVPGDKKISVNEMYFLNLAPDILRAAQCSALSVFSKRSATGKTMTARNLDWPSGDENQVSKAHAVTTFINGNKSICTIGFLGCMGAITGFNSNHVFASVLDSATGAEYSSKSKRSYNLDLRYALENYKTLDQVADFMKSPKRKYTFSHLIFLSDPDTSKVLENNISNSVPHIRDVRTSTSALNSFVTWGISNCIGAVNSFMLKGNFDNYSLYPGNTMRWDSMKRQALSKGNTINLQALKEIASYYTKDKPLYQKYGDIYNQNTTQIVIFEPYSLNLEVFFSPKDSSLPKVPKFEKINVNFNAR